MATSSAARVEGAGRVLTAPAVSFVEDLTRRFRPRIDELEDFLTLPAYQLLVKRS
jgi:hypothetical protein